jgi:aminoglycoside phosphotransferase (APT) family kinase protein
MTEVPTEIRRTTRDPAQLRERLERWMRRDHPGARVGDVRSTSATGMSSDTLLFEASWDDHAPVSLVARLAPAAEDVPVFPSYDLTRQYELMRAAQPYVPVPPAYRNEPDPEQLGTPFFVMGRVDGDVPPDLPPYDFGDSWLFAAVPENQRRLQDATVDLLVGLHRMPIPAFLATEEPLRTHVAKTRAWYEFAAEGIPSPLIEEGFAWLEAHWPATESEAVVCWGDARVGNVIYRDFEPVAVLDWEMAGLGPRELDVSWLIYAHRNFEDIAHMLGLPGMPDFLRRDDVVARYTQAAGVELHDLDWFETYAAVQFAIVYLRVGWRAVHFGERDRPNDPDEFLYNREPLQRMLEGAYF